MSLEKISLDGVDYIRADMVNSLPDVDGDPYVIVRGRNAGVHAGYLAERNQHTLTLKNSRRLWRWWSKFSLSGLAMDGPLASKMSEQRYACVLPELELTCSDVAEVIPCTDKARIAIEAVKEHIND